MAELDGEELDDSFCLKSLDAVQAVLSFRSQSREMSARVAGVQRSLSHSGPGMDALGDDDEGDDASPTSGSSSVGLLGFGRALSERSPRVGKQKTRNLNESKTNLLPGDISPSARRARAKPNQRLPSKQGSGALTPKSKARPTSGRQDSKRRSFSGAPEGARTNPFGMMYQNDEDEEAEVELDMMPSASAPIEASTDGIKRLQTPGTLNNALIWRNEAPSREALGSITQTWPLYETAAEDHHIHHNDRAVMKPRSMYAPPMPIIEPEPSVVRHSTAMSALLEELHRVHRELPDEACHVDLVDSDLFDWEVSLRGPVHSPYRLGNFRFLLKFPHDYPSRMPRIRCATPIYHCNIDMNGTVCLGPFDEDGLSPQAFVSHADMPEELRRTKVVVLIVGAKGLRNADAFGKSDPYCVCQVPGKAWARFQTNVIENSLNPTWNEEYVFNDYHVGDSLEFSVWDSDDGDAAEEPELLGKTTLASAQFYPHGFEGDLSLSDAGKGARASLRVKTVVIEPAKMTGRTTAIDIIKALLSLLSLPVAENALVPSVAKLFQSNRREHDRIAQEWTLRYAHRDVQTRLSAHPVF